MASGADTPSLVQNLSDSPLSHEKCGLQSSVQSAIKGLIEKSFGTTTLGVYEVYDKVFAMWLLRQS